MFVINLQIMLKKVRDIYTTIFWLAIVFILHYLQTL